MTIVFGDVRLRVSGKAEIAQPAQFMSTRRSIYPGRFVPPLRITSRDDGSVTFYLALAFIALLAAASPLPRNALATR
jgi:hypothetical protein